MKKITLALLLSLFYTLGFAQLSEDFEGTVFPPAGWTSYIGANGLGTAANWEVGELGTKTAVCSWETLPAGQRSEDWLVTHSFTVLASAPLLYFDSVDSGSTDYGSIYTVRVSTNSQTVYEDFAIIDTQNETQIAHSQTTMDGSKRILDLSPYVGQNIYVAFVLEQNDGDLWRIDNVKMGGDVSPPNKVTTPIPANGATGVAINTSNAPILTITPFSWVPSTTGDIATSFNFNIGETSSGDDIGTLTNFSSGGGIEFTWEYSTLYYWSVDAVNISGSTSSDVWSFTTEADPSLSVDKNSVVLFSVYPNPVKDKVKIITPFQLETIEVLNQLGQQVLKLNVDSKMNNTLELGSLDSGVYFIKVKAENKTQAVKIIKQ